MHPTHGMFALPFYIVLFGGLFWFCAQVFGRARHLFKARRMERTDRIGERMLGVLKYYLGQSRLFHGYRLAGLLHALIFWGFWAVSVNSVQFIMGGFVFGAHLPLLGPAEPLGMAYLVLRDTFEVIVLIAVLLAMGRRLITRPKRLTYSFEALVILFLIAALMITDFFIGGADAALANPNPASFVEQAMGAWMLGWSGHAAIAAGTVAWWLHLLALLYFLNLLPQSKHFHVVTSAFAVFFRRLDAPVLPKMDLEKAADDGKVGAEQIYDHGWKYLLDSYSCTECGRCQDNCPTFYTGKELNPKKIEVDIRHYIFENQAKLLAGKHEGEDGIPQLLGDTISHQSIWDCTTCRACEEFCPLLIEHLGPIMDARKHLVMDKADFPDELGAFFRNMENQGNPWGIGQDNRTKWAAGLDVPVMAEHPGKEVLLWVGCSASFDARNQKIANSLVKCLNAAGVDFGYLGSEETCNGDSARRAGNEYLFQMMAGQVVETIKKYKSLKKIITPCPHCFNIFKNEYPEFGLSLEVEHHSTTLTNLVLERKLKPAQDTNIGSVAYHDSCYLGRYNGVYSAPRAVLSSVPGVKVVEAERHHEKGMCCGAGGARMFMEEKHGTRINHARIEQLTKSKPDAVATACPYCLTMLSDAVKEKGQENMQVLDIAEVLAAGIGER